MRNAQFFHSSEKLQMKPWGQAVTHKFRCVFGVRWRTGVEAVSGCDLWAVAGGLSLAWALRDRTRSDLHEAIESKCQLHRRRITMWKVRLMWRRCSGGVLTGVVVLLVHNDSVPASPCQEGGWSKSPPPSSCSPSPGLGDNEPSYKTHKLSLWL